MKARKLILHRDCFNIYTEIVQNLNEIRCYNFPKILRQQSHQHP